MRYSRIIVLAMASALAVSSVYAKKDNEGNADGTSGSASSLSVWAKEQASALPSEIDGVVMMRPVANEDGRVEVSEFIDVPGISQTQVFIAAVVYAAENLDRETDAIETIDFDSRRFVVSRHVKSGEGKDAATYRYTTAFQAADDILSFVSYGIEIDYKDKGILPRHMAIEKMKPATNKRHAELIEDFSFNNSKYLKDMAAYVSDNPSLKVTHWKDIKDGTVVKGMNETEVKLVVGAPVSVRKMGKRSKWMFSNDFVVIFTGGVVTTVIQ